MARDRGDAIADLVTGDVTSDDRHGARNFEAGHKREVRGVLIAAFDQQEIGEVQGRRGDLDLNLGFGWLGALGCDERGRGPRFGNTEADHTKDSNI